MTVSLHALALETFAPMLRSLAHVLDKAGAHANETGTAEAALVEARLAPDMFPLKDQVKNACFQACAGVARLVGDEPPNLDGPEATLADLKARIDRALAYIEAQGPARYEGAAEKPLKLHLFGEMWFEGKGFDYLRNWAMAHFYFHTVTTYDILRAQGVPLGKADYMQALGAKYLRRGPAPAK
jgi:hypothetical protein